MPAMWKYPPEIMAQLQKPLPAHVREESARKFADRHAETLARIDARIAEAAELAEEKRLALEWCRANGNPHLEGDATITIEGNRAWGMGAS